MYVCKDCFKDEELRSEVNSNYSKEGKCDVCGKKGKLIDFREFYDFFKELLSFYSPDSGEEGKNIGDIVQQDFTLFANKEVARILLGEILQNYNLGYAEGDKVNYTADIRDRINVWERLKKVVKEESRFFANMDEIIKYGYLTAGKKLRAGEKLYRSRVTPAGQKKIKRTNMGCPPKELATAGRANPAGIPYLYLSDSAKTTYYEVRALYLDKLSVGRFSIQRDLNIVDFVYDANLYMAYTDGSLKETIIKKKVISAISEDLSRPIRRYDNAEIEYVSTQMICEYCKRMPADGIAFKSSLYEDGMNYVLFDASAAKCIEVESHEINKIDIIRKR